jgi:class 3 adenylate cyclase
MAPAIDRPWRKSRDAAAHWRRLLAVLACCRALGVRASGRAEDDADAYAVPPEAPVALRARWSTCAWCGAARRRTGRLPALNARLAAEQMPALRIGVGIATGDVIVGRMGPISASSTT